MTGTGEFCRQYLETEPGRRPWIPPKERPRVPTIRHAGSYMEIYHELIPQTFVIFGGLGY